MIDGMTKTVQFDENGKRSPFDIQIFSLTSQGSIQIGTWDADFHVRSQQIPGVTTSGSDVLRNRTFIVLISMVCNAIFDNNMNLIKKIVIINFRHHPMEC